MSLSEILTLFLTFVICMQHNLFVVTVADSPPIRDNRKNCVFVLTSAWFWDRLQKCHEIIIISSNKEFSAAVGFLLAALHLCFEVAG